MAKKKQIELQKLCDELWLLVEKDQGYGFVAECMADQFTCRAQFFNTVRGWHKHSKIAVNKLEAFMNKHGQPLT